MEITGLMSSLTAGLWGRPVPAIPNISPKEPAEPISTVVPEQTAAEEEAELMISRLDSSPEKQTLSTAEWMASKLPAFLQTNKESLDPDWEFWGEVMANYSATIRKSSALFQRHLYKGIPPTIRGLMWQIISCSKSAALELEYSQYLECSSRHEKLIECDLSRTYPDHEYFKAGAHGQIALFNVLKAYSLYDKEIGYVQGLAFIAGALLLNMPEESAFCVLVRLMKDYAFRALYTPKMIGVQLLSYQFDQMMSIQIPTIYAHLRDMDVQSSMYASQWFLTVFAYRFPIDLVFRVYDVIFAEGAESILKFSLALLKKNESKILGMKFDLLLPFLKLNVFESYDDATQLVTDASLVRLSKAQLEKWSSDFNEKLRRESPDFMECESLRAQNRTLLNEFKSLQQDYEILNYEHVIIATENIRLKAAAENHSERNEELQEKLKALQNIMGADRGYAENSVQAEMQSLASKNLVLTSENARLGELVNYLDVKLKITMTTLDDLKAEKDEIITRIQT